MIIPNKDKRFEESLLKYSIDILKSFNKKINITQLYKENEHINPKDLDAIMVFLYAIGRVNIEGELVIKID